MQKKSTLKNKLYAIVFIIIGALSVFIELDATFFLFLLMLGIVLFFQKENCVK